MLKILIEIIVFHYDFFRLCLFPFFPLDRFRPIINRLNGFMLRLSTSEKFLHVPVCEF